MAKPVSSTRASSRFLAGSPRPSPGSARVSAGSLSPPEWVRYPNLASPDDAESSDIMAMVSDSAN